MFDYSYQILYEFLWLIFCFNFQPRQINRGVESIHYVAFSPLNTLNFFGLLSGFIQSWV